MRFFDRLKQWFREQEAVGRRVCWDYLSLHRDRISMSILVGEKNYNIADLVMKSDVQIKYIIIADGGSEEDFHSALEMLAPFREA